MLLLEAGAISRLLIGSPSGPVPEGLTSPFDAMAGAVRDGGVDLNDDGVKKELVEVAKQWTKSFPVPDLVRDYWKQILKAGAEPLWHVPKPGKGFPAWWTYAMALMIIADEACEGVGYALAATPNSNWIAAMAIRAFWNKNRNALRAISRGKTGIVSEDLPTLCVMADPDVVCVQPKVRTPAVGCTLRSYAQNLALLPPRGIVSTGWQQPPDLLSTTEESTALNILIIPYPFHLRSRWFSGVRVTPVEQETTQSHPWGWFELKQEWLSQHIIDFTEALIREAEKDVGTVHGILFPEYAMNWNIFEKLKDRLLTSFPDVEFLVSGSSSNCIHEDGNFVMSAVFLDLPNGGKKKRANRAALVSSRWKHHRWRLNEPQISAYALGSSLDPRVLWWEAIGLGQREIDLSVFRSSSAFTTLICEDLARNDPCHAVLRDIGPNLVFVMLMDGPQLKSRWSAQYSTTLADDPGCSVLTYTSLGLIERANRAGKYPSSRVIALWKDDTGTSVEIPCPEGAHGVVLSLSDYSVSEETLDGRCTSLARAWRFHSQLPVQIRSKDKKTQRIVDKVFLLVD